MYPERDIIFTINRFLIQFPNVKISICWFQILIRHKIMMADLKIMFSIAKLCFKFEINFKNKTYK